jgi:hypothetical protein
VIDEGVAAIHVCFGDLAGDLSRADSAGDPTIVSTKRDSAAPEIGI